MIDGEGRVLVRLSGYETVALPGAAGPTSWRPWRRHFGERRARVDPRSTGWRCSARSRRRCASPHGSRDRRRTRAAAPRRRPALTIRADAAMVRAADSSSSPSPVPEALAEALAAADVDALWPGWSPGGRGPGHRRHLRPPRREVPRVPTPRRCAAVRDRIAVKRLAEGAGLPVVPWNGGPLDGPDAAGPAAERSATP